MYKSQVLSRVANSGDFQFTNLVACNIDRLNSELISKGNKTFFKSIDSNGDDLLMESVTVMSTVMARTMTYTSNMVYLFNNSKTVIVGKTLSGDLAYMNTTTVNKITKRKDGKSIFQFKVVKPTDISLNDLQKLILQ